MSLFGVGVLEIFIVLLVAFLVLGPKRLPAIAAQMGRSVRSFKKFVSRMTGQFNREFDDLAREYQELRDEVKELRDQVASGDETSFENMTEPASEDLTGNPKP